MGARPPPPTPGRDDVLTSLPAADLVVRARLAWDGRRLWRDPVVAVASGVVTAIGHRGVLAPLLAPSSGAEILDLPGALVLPGLVNAHAHLEYTACGPLEERCDFMAWLRSLVAWSDRTPGEVRLGSARLGAGLMVRAGITCVGDVVSRGQGLQAMLEAGLRGIAYLEFVGGHHDDVELRIGDLEAKVADAAALVGASAHQGVSLGLSPHAPYTVPPAAMRSVLDLAARHGLPVTTHLAESRAEITYLTEGDGDLTEFMATRLGGVAPRSGGGGALAYAASGGLLAGGPGRRTLLVHCAQLEADDVDRLARAHVAVALCPRSNDRLCGGAQAPVAALAGSGIPLAVGTDSLASNAGLDLFAEARALYEIWLRQERGCDPIAVAGRLLRMLTSEGAAALGLDAEAGSLRVGDRADFTALEVPAGPGDVARAVVEGADATAVLTTFIGGRCRYIRGSASPGGEESDDRTDSARAERTAP